MALFTRLCELDVNAAFVKRLNENGMTDEILHEGKPVDGDHTRNGNNPSLGPIVVWYDAM